MRTFFICFMACLSHHSWGSPLLFFSRFPQDISACGGPRIHRREADSETRSSSQHWNSWNFYNILRWKMVLPMLREWGSLQNDPMSVSIRDTLFLGSDRAVSRQIPFPLPGTSWLSSQRWRVSSLGHLGCPPWPIQVHLMFLPSFKNSSVPLKDPSHTKWWI